jgi:hypothetical protein
MKAITHCAAMVGVWAAMVGTPTSGQGTGAPTFDVGRWAGWERPRILPTNAPRGFGVFVTTGSRLEAFASAELIMRWNERLWLAQHEVNLRRAVAKGALEKTGGNPAPHPDSITDPKFVYSPSPDDIIRGDAMNSILDALDHPARTGPPGPQLLSARANVSGAMIGEIPFQYGTGAILSILGHLTEGNSRPALESEGLVSDCRVFKHVIGELREQESAGGRIDDATVAKARAILRGMRSKIETKIPKDSLDRLDAESYLKALYGLVRMLEPPPIDTLLAGVRKGSNTTLGDLLAFMNLFNLRFGPAKTPRQKQHYAELFVQLDRLSDDRLEQAKLTDREFDPTPENQPPKIFMDMTYEQLEGKNDR